MFGFGPTRPIWSADGGAVIFCAPIDGSAELWRASLDGHAIERLTKGRHYLSRASAATTSGGELRVAAIRADATHPPDVVAIDVPRRAVGRKGATMRRLTDLMGDKWAGIELVAPQERWHDVDGRRIQGWFYPARRRASVRRRSCSRSMADRPPCTAGR